MKLWNVEIANIDDKESFLKLSSEVESLFGELVHNQEFINILEKNLIRGTACCVRSDTKPSEILGGVFYSIKKEHVDISWLVVASVCRGLGLGSALCNFIISLFPNCNLFKVETFQEDCVPGLPARQLYLKPCQPPYSEQNSQLC